MANNETASVPTAYLVDLVSNRKIPITTPRCRVGRDDLNDIVISGDQSISRFHFILTFEDARYLVQDAKSRHGTFLNGNQISNPEPINDGDVLKIGVSLFWFVIEQPSAEEGNDLVPVGTDSIKKEEIVVRKKEGSFDIAIPTGTAGAGDLSATQEIEVPHLAEALARVEAELEAEAKQEKAESENDKTPTGTDSEEEPVAKKKSKKGKEDKDSEPVDKKKDEKSEPFKSEAEPIKAEEAEPESKKSEPEPEAKEPEKEEPEATREKEDDEEDDPVAASVKSLLEPLEDELAASKAMIDEALKKAEPESNIALEEVSEPEPPPESKAEEEAGEVKTKFEEEPEPQEEISTSHAEPEEAVSASESEDSPEPESAPESKSDEAKASKNETLEKFAGIIDDSSSGPADDDSGGSKEPTEPVSSAVEQEDESISENANEGATNGTDKSMTMTVEKMVAIKVPDWCKRYFSNELKGLGKELEELNDQIKKTESRIKEIEGQTALTKGLRNTLLTCEDDDLIEACKKVLSLVGWKVTQSEEDKNELLLENDDDRVAIARIIWTKNNAERSHLGQLSISQTRFWCEKGTEPKGVLIVGKITDTEPSDPSETADQELTDYAGKKNVCLMSTLQLLAIYRDLALSDGNSNALRKSIHDCKGWLDGYTLEPGDEILEDDDDKDSSKSKSLSSLLSA